jgi:hypothetical protein
VSANGNNRRYILIVHFVCTCLQEVVGAIRPGNVLRIGGQYVRVACAFDRLSANSVCVRDMVQASFPHVTMDIEKQGGAAMYLFIGTNITGTTALGRSDKYT